MLVPIDDERAVLPFYASADEPGLRLISKSGNQTWIAIGGLSGHVKRTEGGTLVLRSRNAFSLIDPKEDFSVLTVPVYEGLDAQQGWNVAFSGYNEFFLVDTSTPTWFRMTLERNALQLDDPGYTEVTDVQLLLGKSEVALNITRSKHIAIFNYKEHTTELVDLAGRYGSRSHGVLNGTLWLTNYDVLCAMDIDTRRVRASPMLQPEVRDPQHGLLTQAFVGEPFYVPQLDGWLVPRPYSGDVLLVSSESLLPTGRVVCGGRPYEVAAFDDGTLLVADLPFEGVVVRTAHLSDLKLF